MKKILMTGLLATGLVLGLTGCPDDADVASKNLSKAADNFEIDRRIVFYNGITGDYILELVGKCSIGNRDTIRRLSVTCKTGYNTYKKHFLGLSDNVTFFAEQIEGSNVSAYNYRVTFKPQTILPDIDFRGDAGAVIDAVKPDSRD